MQSIEIINGERVLFSNETEYLPNIMSISTFSIARIFGKDNHKVVRDFEEAIRKDTEIRHGKIAEPKLKGFKEGVDYFTFYRDNGKGVEVKAIAVGRDLFYQVVLAYTGDEAFKIRREFIQAYKNLENIVVLQKQEIAELEYKELQTHSNKSKGQNNRRKRELGDERDELRERFRDMYERCLV